MDSLGDAGDLAVLADEVRRELYLYVSAQPEPVGRDEAAAALGIARHQAKFGLDRLEDAGLLETDYVRISGRTGPGAGRPAKVYRRADREIAVSLPGREYALAGELMAQAITAAMRDGVPVEEALTKAAAARGDEIGRAAARAGEPLSIAGEALSRYGYEPRIADGQMTLANCPFHALARDHTDLVCGMNDALLGGVCARIGGITAHLEPADSRCCVVLRTHN